MPADCPRRLFLGAYLGRHDDQDILLNPTGMIETDLLLLSQMAKGPDHWRLPAEIMRQTRSLVAAFWLPPHDALDHASRL